jgi:hypothetical protein
MHANLPARLEIKPCRGRPDDAQDEPRSIQHKKIISSSTTKPTSPFPAFHIYSLEVRPLPLPFQLSLPSSIVPAPAARSLLSQIVSNRSSHLTEDAPELACERREFADVVDTGLREEPVEEAAERIGGAELWLGC